MSERAPQHTSEAFKKGLSPKKRIPESVSRRVYPIATALAIGFMSCGCLESQQVQAQEAKDVACTTLGGDPVPKLHEAPFERGEFRCIGTSDTKFGSNITILQHFGKTTADNFIKIIERDQSGKSYGEVYIQLNYPDTKLPKSLEFNDYLGNLLYCPLLEDDTYDGCTIVKLAPEPTSEPPTKMPSEPVFTGNTGPLIVEHDGDDYYYNQGYSLSAATHPKEVSPGMCVDSFGQDIVLHQDRIGTDDCIRIRNNYPLRGDTTYVYQSEPEYGFEALINVVLKQDGRIFWKIDPNTQLVDSIGVSVKDALSAFSKLFTLRPLSITARTEAPSSVIQLPRGVVADEVLKHYNTIKPIAECLNYDPRTHLGFIHVETKGTNGLTSVAGAQGLVQIMPGTWIDIQNVIKSNAMYQACADKVGVDPATASPWNDKDNIFFSAIYLVSPDRCRLPLGTIPTKKADLQSYILGVQHAAIRYHDGPGTDVSRPSNCLNRACGVEYVSEIGRIIPGLVNR